MHIMAPTVMIWVLVLLLLLPGVVLVVVVAAVAAAVATVVAVLIAVAAAVAAANKNKMSIVRLLSILYYTKVSDCPDEFSTPLFPNEDAEFGPELLMLSAAAKALPPHSVMDARLTEKLSGPDVKGPSEA